ncbi:MAG: isoprenylcysteine carboxylmethyltransferase family protein [Gemmatimonadota bacterium]|nr:isoprenylcysteine carboxylmethyltransferase family protein [Gemmatimonadota bacterium]
MKPRSARLFAALRSVLYGTVFVLLWGWLALEVRALDGALGGPLPMWTPLAGILVMTLGGALALACLASFSFIGGGTPAPFDAPRELVVAGPYRWVRNPLYVAGFLMLVGFGLLHRSPAILVLATVFVGLFHLFVIGYEEPRLAGEFGASYEAYRRRVPRWLPRRPGVGG